MTQEHQQPLAEVRDRTAFITGGSSGIGLGMARAFSAAGMKVAFTYRQVAHRDAALATFAADNAGVHAIALDTTDRAAFARALAEVREVFGNVHLLCNNAGVGITAAASSCSFEDWDWAVDVNLTGVFNGIRTVLPHLLEHGEGGHVVTTSSSGGLLAGSLGVYCTTKFAVMGLMESLRVEMQGKNIGVSVFCPGLVKTRIFDSERNRPSAHGGPRAPAGPPAALPGFEDVDLMAGAMDSLTAGEKVLEGIRRNDLFILSHGEFAPAVRERYEAMAASFSTDPVPAARKAATDTFTPDIYRREVERKAGR
ncbi:SDR family NAD(P)-dependent oxidoreductase [bacterium]|nr:MAG: SDR family NAD(P)-dependent oxidoreductase [bacterium]